MRVVIRRQRRGAMPHEALPQLQRHTSPPSASIWLSAAGLLYSDGVRSIHIEKGKAGAYNQLWNAAMGRTRRTGSASGEWSNKRPKTEKMKG